VVNQSGKATDIKVVKSLGDGLDEKAIEAVQKWLFKPGLVKGIPVAVRAEVKVSFTLL
jgi:TonB family protein